MALLFSALLASCQKEDGTVTTVTLIAEEMQSDTKFAVDGVHSYWCGSDKVRINSSGELWVNTTSEQAKVTGSFTTPLRALSPASLYEGDLTTNTVAVTLPSTYQYSKVTVSGSSYQHVQSPMAAYAESGNELLFKHLTAALMVKITNSTGGPIYVESITISSDKYKLNGSRTIDFTNLTASTIPTSANASERTVAMRFDNYGFLTMSSGAVEYVQIPVPAVGDDNHFTVTVQYRNYGDSYTNGQHCYTKTLTQSGSSNHLWRGQMAYVPFEVATSGAGVTKDYFFADEDGYYTIADKWQLRTLANVGSNLSNAKVKLTRDFSMSGLLINPIENVKIFDGGSHTISNLSMTTTDAYCGLLKSITGTYAEHALVKDLTINKCTLQVASSAQYVGALVAKTISYADISGCSITGLLTVKLMANNGNSVHIGGLVGYNQSNLTITNCSVADIKYDNNSPFYTSNVYCGGFVGYSHIGSYCTVTNSNVNISQSGNTLLSSGPIRFGGFVGYTGATESNYMTFNSTTVSISNLTVTSSGNDCYAGVWVGQHGDQLNTDRRMAGDGNSTSGSFDVYVPSGQTLYYGNAANNRFVCGLAGFKPSTTQETDDLQMNIIGYYSSK